MSDTDQAPAQAQARVGRLLLLAVIVGVVSSLGAVAFTVVEHQVQNYLWNTLPTQLGWAAPPWFWVLGVLLAGAVLTWAASHLRGGGGHSPLDQMAFNIGPSEVVSVVLAALATLSFGAVLGPEAPLLAIGSALAALAYRGGVPTERKIIMLAGAVAAMGTILGNPLVTAILILEAAAIKGSPGGRQAMSELMPVLLALGFGYLIQVGVGNWGGFGESVLSIPGLQPYDTVQGVDILAAFPVAIVVGIAAVISVEIGERVRPLAGRRPLPTILAAAVVIAVMAISVTAITGEPVSTVLFSGESAMPQVLTITSVGTLAMIAVAKVVGYGVSLGGGFHGGKIFPSVYIGVVVGMAISLMLADTNSSALVAAGVAAGVGAVLRLPFTATLLAVLLCSAAGLAVTTTAIVGALIGVLIRVAIDARLTARQPDQATAPAAA